ncbi:unnamed protein product [Amoebophrya sp. A25]|nr:unnamed protein product [Amoebophrya sp. A25]|eukprot:GSA25T00016787001.1
MYGLHGINHMFASNNISVVLDPYFRGGKIGYEKMSQHPGTGGSTLAMVPVQESKYKYKAFDVGFGGGVKLDQKMGHVRERLDKCKEDTTRIREAGRRAVEGFTAEREGPVARSLQMHGAMPYKQERGVVLQGAERAIPKVEETRSVFERPRGMVWEAGDAKKYGFNAYSRAPYGGMWKR